KLVRRLNIESRRTASAPPVIPVGLKKRLSSRRSRPIVKDEFLRLRYFRQWSPYLLENSIKRPMWRSRQNSRRHVGPKLRSDGVITGNLCALSKLIQVP